MQTRSPVNNYSPKLVEMVRVKPLSLGFGDYLSLNKDMVDSRICNLRTINRGPAPSSAISKSPSYIHPTRGRGCISWSSH
jgi:hypothetical protein